MQIRFKYEKETKNTVRFKEIGEPPIVEYLYIQKSALQTLDYKGKENIIITLLKEEQK